MKKRLLIVLPDGRIHRIRIGSYSRSFREAPLTATALAALVPEELDFDISIADESIGQNPICDTVDIVAISLLTGTCIRGYEIADYYRSNNVPVVLGGVHVTLLPEEAKQHADAIVVGFAEKSWPELLRDFSYGSMKPVYIDQKDEFKDIPIPRRDLQKKTGYMVPNVVSATRGCMGTCDFCSVYAARFGWHKRPVGEVIDEIRNIQARRIVFNDVSMGEDMEHFKELLRAMVPLKKMWGGLVSTRVFNDPEIPELLQRSGCVYLLIGMESLNDYSLKRIKKGFNKFADYERIIDIMHRHNIVLMGCFIFGFDEDEKDIFQKTVAFVNDYKVDIPRYAIYTPYPQTEAFSRLHAENRILHQHWQHYDTQHVVFHPKNMTPEELDSGFIWAYENTFTLASSFRRTVRTSRNFPITFGGNMAYNIYIKRLRNEKNRILYS